MPPILRSCALFCSTVVKEFFSLLLFFLCLHELPLGETFITATATGIQSAWCKSFPWFSHTHRHPTSSFRANFSNEIRESENHGKSWKTMETHGKFREIFHTEKMINHFGVDCVDNERMCMEGEK